MSEPFEAPRLVRREGRAEGARRDVEDEEPRPRREQEHRHRPQDQGQGGPCGPDGPSDSDVGAGSGEADAVRGPVSADSFPLPRRSGTRGCERPIRARRSRGFQGAGYGHVANRDGS